MQIPPKQSKKSRILGNYFANFDENYNFMRAFETFFSNKPRKTLHKMDAETEFNLETL